MDLNENVLEGGRSEGAAASRWHTPPLSGSTAPTILLSSRKSANELDTHAWNFTGPDAEGVEKNSAHRGVLCSNPVRGD